MDQSFLAFLSPGVIGVFVPIIALTIPIVAILVRHQQRMAEIIHSSGSNVDLAQQIEALRREVAELRQLVHRQTLALDSAIQDRRSGEIAESSSIQA